MNMLLPLFVLLLVPAQLNINSDNTTRVYSTGTLSVKLIAEGEHMTAVDLVENGDADEVIIESFYWSALPGKNPTGQELLLHKETFTPVMDGLAMAGDIPLALKDIVFIRVHEMKLLRDTEFGKVPGRQ